MKCCYYFVAFYNRSTNKKKRNLFSNNSQANFKYGKVFHTELFTQIGIYLIRYVWAFWINVLIKRRKSFIFMFVSFSNIAVSGYYFFSSERSNDTCNIHKPIFISSSFHELLDILSCLLKVQLSLIWNYVRVESIPTSWFCYISPCVVSKLKISYFLQKYICNVFLISCDPEEGILLSC